MVADRTARQGRRVRTDPALPVDEACPTSRRGPRRAGRRRRRRSPPTAGSRGRRRTASRRQRRGIGDAEVGRVDAADDEGADLAGAGVPDDRRRVASRAPRAVRRPARRPRPRRGPRRRRPGRPPGSSVGRAPASRAPRSPARRGTQASRAPVASARAAAARERAGHHGQPLADEDDGPVTAQRGGGRADGAVGALAGQGAEHLGLGARRGRDERAARPSRGHEWPAGTRHTRRSCACGTPCAAAGRRSATPPRARTRRGGRRRLARGRRR